MKNSNRSIGKTGEEIAVKYLEKKKYKILKVNYQFHRYEIDIIAKNKKNIVFIEVKRRNSCFFGKPEDAVTRPKQRNIIIAAKKYLVENKMWDSCFSRFDVIAIYANGEVKHIISAFEAD
ncbi:MAG: YraN family protein [Candidatus Aureabacteria bacterium]|nr:YraN family protein [Candidatus Auribacterota bacterium]